MAVLPMDKIQILGMKNKLQAVLRLMQKKGLMQIDEVVGLDNIENLEREDHDLDFQIAQVDFAIKLLKDYAPKRAIWLGKPSYTAENAKGLLKSFDHEAVIKACQKLEEKHVADQNEQAALKAEASLLENWKKLPFTLDLERTTESSQIFTGTVSKEAFVTLKKELKAMSELVDLLKVHEGKVNVNIIVVVAKDHIDQARLIMNKNKYSEVELPSHKKTVNERLKQIKELQSDLEEKMKTHEKEFTKLGKDSENLQIVHDVLVWKQGEHDVQEKLKGTDYSFLIMGWIAKKDRKALITDLEEIDKAVAIKNVKLEENEQAPIYLHNKKASWPFESVTRLYGFPTASEVDPTPYLATFFIIFFALCLTDAGYGLSLFVIMFSLLKFFNLPQESKGLIKLLMWGGLVTMVAGYFFGGYFGLTVDQAPAFMVSDGTFKGQLINATKGNGPLTFLILALAIGIVHVLFGKLIDGIWKIKHKQYMDALLDSFLWIYFIIVIICFGMASAGVVLPTESAPLFKWLTLGGVAAMILTQGRKQKSLAGKIGLGVLSLYGLVGYLGDILSYSRIMALGLGTGIIAFAMNTIAGLAYELIPYVGFIFAGLVLLMGHLMNLVLSALGAFIHSARLQFVEFFSKFMEGGGTEFVPFKRECKYITIK